ncbi:MAG: hypothetical protein IPJ65_36060 [Archangiaceae bacterium]|nr:hypothetical protein [Archangiaceae bacterium]
MAVSRAGARVNHSARSRPAAAAPKKPKKATGSRPSPLEKPPSYADARESKALALFEMMKTQGSLGPQYLESAIFEGTTLAVPPDQALKTTFGGDTTEESVCRAYGGSHPDAELLPQNFMTLPSYGDGVVAVGVFTEKGKPHRPLGYIVDRFVPNGEGQRVNELVAVAIDQRSPKAKGLVDQALEANESLSRKARVDHQELTASSIGRYRWAQSGFDFAEPATLKAATAQLKRFAADLGLRKELGPPGDGSVFFARPDGTREPFSWDKLEHAWDFAQLVCDSGPVAVEVTLALDASGQMPRERVYADLGKAFMLGSKYDAKGQRTHVMPDWHGVRPMGEHTPGQRQQAAYQAQRLKRP